MTDCVVCGNRMKTMKDWYKKCTHCAWMVSSLTPGAGAEIGGIESLRLKNFNQILDLLAERVNLSEVSLLEVGCSEGLFLLEANKRGISTLGIEPEPHKFQIAKDKNLNVIQAFFPPEDQLGQFDVVVFNDVFEHLPDPARALRAVHELLNKDGLLILNLPSSQGVLYRVSNMLSKFNINGYLERLWQKSLASPHITYFNPSNLERFVEKQGGFEEVYRGHLESVQATGLKERVYATMSGMSAKLTYLALRSVVPLFSILPKDITLQFFRKT